MVFVPHLPPPHITNIFLKLLDECEKCTTQYLADNVVIILGPLFLGLVSQKWEERGECRLYLPSFSCVPSVTGLRNPKFEIETLLIILFYKQANDYMGVNQIKFKYSCLSKCPSRSPIKTPY